MNIIMGYNLVLYLLSFKVYLLHLKERNPITLSSLNYLLIWLIFLSNNAIILKKQKEINIMDNFKETLNKTMYS